MASLTCFRSPVFTLFLSSTTSHTISMRKRQDREYGKTVITVHGTVRIRPVSHLFNLKMLSHTITTRIYSAREYGKVARYFASPRTSPGST
ncbi:hypothetical protein F4777DRAFT_194354 [Nemania sp. FL0916]|nr:hypothetical protein F4777DRAFT_194354 [Nemania sp. FL0916]